MKIVRIEMGELNLGYAEGISDLEFLLDLLTHEEATEEFEELEKELSTNDP